MLTASQRFHMDSPQLSSAYAYGGRNPENQQNEILSEYGDRYIPSRGATLDWESRFALLDTFGKSHSGGAAGSSSGAEHGLCTPPSRRREVQEDSPYLQLLKGELIGGEKNTARPVERNLFSYSKPCRSPEHCADNGAFSLSPHLRAATDNTVPCTKQRKLEQQPIRVLDAPGLKDDFYLKLLDWSCKNVLAVVLEDSVYFWIGATKTVEKLCSLSEEGHLTPTSISWSNNGAHVALGTSHGEVEIWDAETSKKLRTMTGHQGRVGTSVWNRWLLTTGGRDASVVNWDVRQPAALISRNRAHKLEVCGLSWSCDEQHLASGGNDNKLCIWSLHSNKPVAELCQHKAAVRAVAWSPDRRSVLASGGGTADGCIRVWNTSSAKQEPEACIQTRTQVCAVMWSRTSKELVSTHGYSSNAINVWAYPSLNRVASLKAHTCRVLHLAMSPDGATLVSGAADNTLRFWKMFPEAKVASKSYSFGHTIR